MTNSKRTIKNTPKKYHLLNATKQIYKKKKIHMKKIPMLFAMNGVILKQNTTLCHKIRLIIKNMKMKLLVRNMKTTTTPKVYRAF